MDSIETAISIGYLPVDNLVELSLNVDIACKKGRFTEIPNVLSPLKDLILSK